MLSKLNIDYLPSAEELQVKVVSLNDSKVKVLLPSELTILLKNLSIAWL